MHIYSHIHLSFTTMLIRGFGVVVADVGHFQATGICLEASNIQENSASITDQTSILTAVDLHFIPELRRQFHSLTPSADVWPFTCGVTLDCPQHVTLDCLPRPQANLAPKLSLRCTGHFIRQEPAATADAVLDALDACFLPLVRRQVAAAIGWSEK
jgi:hypothetical protein